MCSTICGGWGRIQIVVTRRSARAASASSSVSVPARHCGDLGQGSDTVSTRNVRMGRGADVPAPHLRPAQGSRQCLYRLSFARLETTENRSWRPPESPMKTRQRTTQGNLRHQGPIQPMRVETGTPAAGPRAHRAARIHGRVCRGCGLGGRRGCCGSVRWAGRGDQRHPSPGQSDTVSQDLRSGRQRECNARSVDAGLIITPPLTLKRNWGRPPKVLFESAAAPVVEGHSSRLNRDRAS